MRTDLPAQQYTPHQLAYRRKIEAADRARRRVDVRAIARRVESKLGKPGFFSDAELDEAQAFIDAFNGADL